MNKKDLIKAVARKTNLSKKIADRAIDAIFEAIKDTLCIGEKVQIIGFGTFSVKEKQLSITSDNYSLDTADNCLLIPCFKAGKVLKEIIRKETNTSRNKKNISEYKQHKKSAQTIDFHDFLVRTSIFACRYRNHVIENINGKLSLLMPSGSIKEVLVSAGYCPDCNIYFLLESTYKQLEKCGNILCRVTDNKNFYSGHSYLSGAPLAKESILMQYGYSVSQTRMLSDKMRHIILSMIIERHILSKVEIIGYIDFFINQKKANSKYKQAIIKWSLDRDYVRNYQLNNIRNITISKLKR